MNRKISLSLMLATALLLTSCAGKFAPSSDYFKVTPEVLVVQGGQVAATIDGTFPAKSFPATAVVTITPVLKYEGGEALGTPLTLQGTKVKANNKVIGKEGGAVSLSTVYKYVPAMSKSELYLRFNTTIGKKSISIPDIKVADGVISTEALANAAGAKPTASKDKFQRVIQEAHEASILFLIQQAKLRDTELKSEKVTGLTGKIAETSADANKQLAAIEVSSYASPDGSLSLNEKLAADREKATVDFLNKALKDAKATGNIDARFTAEDWEGFQQLVAASSMQDKELILRVLSMYQDPEKREQEIKNLSAVYKNLADEILPQLRRSKMKVTVDIIGKTDEQLKDMAINNPTALTLEEMLYAGTLMTTPADKEKVYKKASELFPNDYRAFNNLGVCAFQQGNVQAAKSYFDKAYSLNKSAEVSSNLALTALATGADAATVNSYLGAAAGSEGLKEAQGILYLKQGEYAKAVTAFGDLKTNNAALAQLLAKDYSKAKSTLDAIAQPNAETSYLKALVGARTNNKDMVISGLSAAVKADKTYAKKAINDIEFSKYLLDAGVAALLK
ncbi:MAG: tetratricopeptide repeat protein [Bacteroidales bacterium]|jgi:tetratricopeptide (TPR) repeat protein|nr:tetratricopeptide repeat protein [Bacteroidales bacterium]